MSFGHFCSQSTVYPSNKCPASSDMSVKNSLFDTSDIKLLIKILIMLVMWVLILIML